MTRGLNTVTHIHTHFAYNDDTDPSTSPAKPVITGGNATIMKMVSGADDKGLRLWVNSADGTVAGKKVLLATNDSGAYVNSNIYADGIAPGTLTAMDIYYFRHATRGWFQMWLGGVKVCEKADTNTWNAAFDAIYFGSIAKPTATDYGFFWFDGIVIDNALPPALPAGVSLHLWSYPDADYTEWNSAATNGGTLSYPAGRSTSCVQAVNADNSGQTMNYRTIPAQAAGDLLFDEYFQIDDDANTGALSRIIARLENAANAAGVLISYMVPPNGSEQWKLRVSNTSGDSLTTTAHFDLTAYTHIQVWVRLNATSGAVLMKVDGTTVLTGNLVTLPNGSIDRLGIGFDNNGRHDGWAVSVRHDDGSLTINTPSEWSPGVAARAFLLLKATHGG